MGQCCPTVCPRYIWKGQHYPATNTILQWAFKLNSALATAYCDQWGMCAQHTRLTVCSRNTDNVLYKLHVSTLHQVCNFSSVLTVATGWWFPCKPKHVGAVFLILKYFNNSTFFNIVCISWKLKCWMMLARWFTWYCCSKGKSLQKSLKIRIQSAVNNTYSVLQHAETGFQFHVRWICPQKITHGIYFSLLRN